MPKSLHTRHNDIFLHLLRKTRVRVNLRQTDLADMLGGSQATISKIERGERRLDVIQLRDWLEALEVDFVAFMQELDEQLRPHPVVALKLRGFHRGRVHQQSHNKKARNDVE